MARPEAQGMMGARGSMRESTAGAWQEQGKSNDKGMAPAGQMLTVVGQIRSGATTRAGANVWVWGQGMHRPGADRARGEHHPEEGGAGDGAPSLTGISACAGPTAHHAPAVHSTRGARRDHERRDRYQVSSRQIGGPVGRVDADVGTDRVGCVAVKSIPPFSCSPSTSGRPMGRKKSTSCGTPPPPPRSRPRPPPHTRRPRPARRRCPIHRRTTRRRHRCPWLRDTPIR